MKFLVIGKPRATGAPLSSKTAQAQKDYINALLANGSLDYMYAFVGGGAFGILNADSPEQVQQQLTESPVFFSTELEVHPLTDYNKTVDGLIEVLKKLGL